MEEIIIPKEKYIVYLSFIIECDDIEIAEREAQDIAITNIKDSRVDNLQVSVRGTSL